MFARRDGEDNMSPVKLASRQEVKRSSKHSHPCSDCCWMKIDSLHTGSRSLQACHGQDPPHQPEDQRISEFDLRSHCSGWQNVRQGKCNNQYDNCDYESCNWPSDPMSNKADRERIGDLMRMNAPNVPINVGAGIKNGSVAFTR